MRTRKLARSGEHPPSPYAPRIVRPYRDAVIGGAAVVAMALATAFGPAAADIGSNDDPSRRPTASQAVAVPTRTVDPDPYARAVAAKEQADRVRLVLARKAAADRAAADRAAADRAAADRAAAASTPPPAPPEPERQPAPPAPTGGPWDALAQCESGGNWSVNTGNGYYGGLQFSLGTWRSHGGQGMPHQQSRAAQIAIAQRVQASQGWGAWPGCAGQLGLT